LVAEYPTATATSRAALAMTKCSFFIVLRFFY